MSYLPEADIILEDFNKHISEGFAGMAWVDHGRNAIIVDIIDDFGTGRSSISAESIRSVKINNHGEVAIRTGKRQTIIKSGMEFAELGNFCKANMIEIELF